eukprot:450731-Lingulodinium_polyedra.AAC.1
MCYASPSSHLRVDGWVGGRCGLSLRRSTSGVARPPAPRFPLLPSPSGKVASAIGPPRWSSCR